MRLSPSVRTTAAVLFLGLAVAAAATRTWRHRVVPGEPSVPHYGFDDFRDGVYYPTLAFVSGDNPYDAERYLQKYPAGDRAPLYSPLMYLMYAPLTWLPFMPAAVLHFALSVPMTIGLGAVVLSWSGVALTTARVAALGALLILSRPGLVNLFNGQVTVVAVCAAYAAFWYAATRPALAAVALAVSTFKGTYGLPVALLLGIRGDRRVVALGCLVAFLITVPAAARIVVTAGGVGPVVQTVRESLSTRLTIPRKRPEYSHFRIDTVALVARTLGRSPSTPATLAIMAGILGAAGAALRRLRPDGDRARRLHATSIAVLAAVAAFYHQHYDGLALVLPLVVLIARPDLEPWRTHPRWRWAALATTAFPFVNYLAIEAVGDTLGEAVLLTASSVNGAAILAAFAMHVALVWRMP